jgi:phosphoglycolate phosphatase-like HAD superfamily hydrolase
LNITLQIKDPDGISVSPSGTVTVDLSSSSTGGIFLSSGQAVTSVTISPGGISSASFQYQDTVAGAPTLTASATGFISAQQQETGALDHLSITAPARVAMNSPFSVTVSALDPNGNVDLGYTGPATLTLKAAPTGGKLAGKLVGTFASGVATFPGLSLNRLGAYTLFSPGSSTVLAATAQVKVVTVTHFGITVSGVPSTGLVAGQPATFTVSALDSSGAIVSNYTGTIHFTSSDPRAVKPANYPFTLADNGSHSFSIPLETAGRQTITVTSTTQPKIRSTSPPVLVIAATLDHLLITGYPHTVVSGQPHNVTVQAVDAYNNRVSSYTGRVKLSSTDSAALGLPASFIYSKADAGRHTFTGVILKTLGRQSLFAQDTGEDYSYGMKSNPYAVMVVAPGLSVSGPSSVAAGKSFTITVAGLTGSVIDPHFSDTVGFSTSDSSAGPYLPGNTTFTTSNRGSRQFTITLFRAGWQTITITDLTHGYVKQAVLTVLVSPD